jgi:hypothetical protein
MSLPASDHLSPASAGPCSDADPSMVTAPAVGPNRRAEDSWLDSAPFRAHVRHLMATSGLTIGELAALTDVSARLLRRLLHGRAGRPARRIDPISAGRLFSVTPLHASLARSHRVPGKRARANALLLLHRGRTAAALAQLTGLSTTDVVRLAAGDLDPCPQIVDLRLTAALREFDGQWCEPARRAHPAAAAA